MKIARGRFCAKIVDLPTMAKTPHTNRRYREDLSEMPDWLKKKTCPNRDKYLAGKRILPKNLTGKEKLANVIDNAFLAYNAARLKEGCQLFAEKMLEPDVTVGMSLSGALTPAGLGCSSIVPLIRPVLWIGSSPPAPSFITTCTSR